MEAKKTSPLFLLLLVITAGLAEVATDIYVPALPLLADTFISSGQRVQLTMSLHLVGFVFGQPFFGALCDGWGRRPALLLGLGVFILGSLGCALSTSLNNLILCRLIQGMGACSAPIVGIATLRDLFEGRAGVRALSIMTATTAFSPILGPVLGSAIVEYYGWRPCFGTVAGSVLVCASLLWLFMKETRPEGHDSEAWKNRSPSLYLAMLRDKEFVGCLLYNGMMVGTAWLFVSVAPGILLEEYERPTALYGFFQATTMVPYALACALVGHLVMRMGSRPLNLAGFSSTLLCAALLVAWTRLPHHPFYLFLMMGLFLASFAFVRPSVIHHLMSIYPKQRGLAASWLGMSEMGCAALSIESYRRLFPHSTAENFSLMLLGWCVIASLVMLALSSFLWEPEPTPDSAR